jgi:hypothetical protein
MKRQKSKKSKFNQLKWLIITATLLILGSAAVYFYNSAAVSPLIAGIDGGVDTLSGKSEGRNTGTGKGDAAAECSNSGGSYNNKTGGCRQVNANDSRKSEDITNQVNNTVNNALAALRSKCATDKGIWTEATKSCAYPKGTSPVASNTPATPTVYTDASCPGGASNIGGGQWAQTGGGIAGTDTRYCVQCGGPRKDGKAGPGVWGDTSEICGQGNAKTYITRPDEVLDCKDDSNKNKTPNCTEGKVQGACWKNGTWYADTSGLGSQNCFDGNWLENTKEDPKYATEMKKRCITNGYNEATGKCNEAPPLVPAELPQGGAPNPKCGTGYTVSGTGCKADLPPDRIDDLASSCVKRGSGMHYDYSTGICLTKSQAITPVKPATQLCKETQTKNNTSTSKSYLTCGPEGQQIYQFCDKGFKSNGDSECNLAPVTFGNTPSTTTPVTSTPTITFEEAYAKCVTSQGGVSGGCDIKARSEVDASVNTQPTQPNQPSSNTSLVVVRDNTADQTLGVGANCNSQSSCEKSCKNGTVTHYQTNAFAPQSKYMCGTVNEVKEILENKNVTVIKDNTANQTLKVGEECGRWSTSTCRSTCKNGQYSEVDSSPNNPFAGGKYVCGTVQEVKTSNSNASSPTTPNTPSANTPTITFQEAYDKCVASQGGVADGCDIRARQEVDASENAQPNQSSSNTSLVVLRDNTADQTLSVGESCSSMSSCEKSCENGKVTHYQTKAFAPQNKYICGTTDEVEEILENKNVTVIKDNTANQTLKVGEECGWWSVSTCRSTCKNGQYSEVDSAPQNAFTGGKYVCGTVQEVKAVNSNASSPTPNTPATNTPVTNTSIDFSGDKVLNPAQCPNGITGEQVDGYYTCN